MPRIKPPKPDFGPRIVRLEQIAAALFGKVLTVDHDLAELEIPADLSSACASMLGASGFSGYIVAQDCRQAPRRIADQDGRTIVTDQITTMAFYRYRVELADRHVKVADLPHAAAIAITRPTKPVGT
jgi:hypothetical protein